MRATTTWDSRPGIAYQDHSFDNSYSNCQHSNYRGENALSKGIRAISASICEKADIVGPKYPANDANRTTYDHENVPTIAVAQLVPRANKVYD